ncbi:hypothetical protein V6N13_140433 [Hibiscus sabdariffa]
MAADISREIAKLRQDGRLQILENAWFKSPTTSLDSEDGSKYWRMLVPCQRNLHGFSLSLVLCSFALQKLACYEEMGTARDCETMGREIPFSINPVTALDGLVNVNSLFTVVVFVGLSLTTPRISIAWRIESDIDVAEKLLVFEVVSFSFFLFSSLVAQGLKLATNLLNSKDVDEVFRAHINLKVLRFGMMGSAVGSVVGCLFLMLSMVDVIEIRLGMLSCGSTSPVHAVARLSWFIFPPLFMLSGTEK